MIAEAHLVDLPLLPLERCGGLVVHGDEPVDGAPDLARRGVAGPDQRAPPEDAEPDLDLVEPARVGRREVEVDVPMAGQPAIVAGLVGVEVVEDDVDLQVGIGMGREDLVHEVEELDPAAALVVARGHEAGGHLEGGEEGRRAVPLVLVGEAGERPPVGQRS